MPVEDFKGRNAKIRTMEAALGITGTAMIVKKESQLARLAELQAQIEAKGLTPTTAPAAFTPELIAKVDRQIDASRTLASIAQPAQAGITALALSAKDYLQLAPTQRQQFAQDGGRISRADFYEKMTLAAQSVFIRNGGRLADKEEPKPAEKNHGPNTKTRAQWETLQPIDRSKFILAGGRIID